MTEIFFWTIQTIALMLLFVMIIMTIRERQSVLAMAKQTWKEAVRQKALWLVVIFAILLIGSTVFIQVAGSETVKEGRRIRVMLETSFRAMSLFTVLTAIFLTSLSIPTDIAHRSIYLLLSKPISRWGLMVGKIIGFCVTTLFMLGLMTLFFLFIIRYSHSDIPKNVKEQILNAREIIQPSSSVLLSSRTARIKKDHVLLVMRHQFPMGSMTIFGLNEPAKIAGKKELPIRLKFTHFKDSQFQPVYTDGELKDCHAIIDLIEPTTMRAERTKLTVDPITGLSHALELPKHIVSPESIGIRIVSLFPPMRTTNKLIFVRGGESIRWNFRNVERSVLATEIEFSDKSISSRPKNKIDSRADDHNDPWITVQIKLRVVDSKNYYGKSDKVEFTLGYRWPEETEDRGKVIVQMRDNRMTTARIPASAVSDNGGLELILSNHSQTKYYFAYDNEQYNLALLSAPRSFEFNVCKAVLMMSFQNILLIIMAVSFSTFLSWPVTALATLFVYFCGNLVSTFEEVLRTIEKGGLSGHGHGVQQSHTMSWIDEFLHTILSILRVIMPDMTKFNPLSLIGNGYSVGIPEIVKSFCYMSIFATITLVIGWLIFRKRSIE